MNCEKLLNTLKKDFIKIKSDGDIYQRGSNIYVKEIRKNIFLVFNVLEKQKTKPIHAMIATFDSVENIGRCEPKQLLFYSTINNTDDFRYFEKYMKC